MNRLTTPSRHRLQAVPAAQGEHSEVDDETEALFDLRAAAKNSEESQLIYERLVEGHLGLVNAIASRYRGRGVEWDDLVQVGRLGLCKAITGYQKGKGHCFLAYAAPTISGEIKRYFRDHVWDVRPPRRLQELQLAMCNREEALCQELGHTPCDAELAASLQVEEPALREAKVAQRRSSTLSLDVPAEGGSSWSDRLPADQDGLQLVGARSLLRPAIEVLATRERQILYLRFVCGCTQQEIGACLGVSQMQISRLLSRILGKLRAQVAPPVKRAEPDGRPVCITTPNHATAPGRGFQPPRRR